MKQDLKLSRDLGFLRVGAAVPIVRVADVDSNVSHIIDAMRNARNEGVQVLVFPEMAVTGYTIGDLVQQQALLAKAKVGLDNIAAESVENGMMVVVGLVIASVSPQTLSVKLASLVAAFAAVGLSAVPTLCHPVWMEV